MSSSPTISENHSEHNDRRFCPRKPLRWVVLVFLGQDNWGKLIDISQSGLSFEFAQAPSLDHPIDFTFEAMGRMPASMGGEIVSESFRASGKVIWIREFERTAGVRFVQVAEESREQLRRWLSFEAFANSIACEDEPKQKASRPRPESLGLPGHSLQTPRKADVDAPELEWELAESSEGPLAECNTEIVPKLEQKFALDTPLEASTKDRATEEETKESQPLEFPQATTQGKDRGAEEKQVRNWKMTQFVSQLLGSPKSTREAKREQAADSPTRMYRTGLIAVAACMAVLGLFAGARIVATHWPRRVEAVQRTLNPSLDQGKSLATEHLSAAESSRPFLVEVLDSDNRSWLLWFARNAPKDASSNFRPGSAWSSFRPAHIAQAAARERPAASGKSEPTHNFALVGPKLSRPKANDLTVSPALAAVPAVPGGLATSPEGPSGAIFTNAAKPVPVVQSLSVGGAVREARLLESVPPFYPQLAKANHVAGDVTLDALIDATGSVTAVEAVSGPTLLRQAAMEAVRQWKYEPARLNGLPVPMHLSVVVKFRIN